MQLNLKTTVSVPTEVEINIESPTFFKTIVSGDITEYLGVIEECTINIWDFKGTRTFIENCATEKRTAEIAKAYNSWEHISEEEFFDALNKALKDFDFKATMRLIHESA
jgi:hypothetical protein